MLFQALKEIDAKYEQDFGEKHYFIHFQIREVRAEICELTIKRYETLYILVQNLGRVIHIPVFRF